MIRRAIDDYIDIFAFHHLPKIVHRLSQRPLLLRFAKARLVEVTKRHQVAKCRSLAGDRSPAPTTADQRDPGLIIWGTIFGLALLSHSGLLTLFSKPSGQGRRGSHCSRRTQKRASIHVAGHIGHDGLDDFVLYSRRYS
jgi:hypothetical protein